MFDTLYVTEMHVIDVVLACVLLFLTAYAVFSYVRELRSIRSRLTNIEKILAERAGRSVLLIHNDPVEDLKEETK